MLKKSIICKKLALFMVLTTVIFSCLAPSALAYSENQVIGSLSEPLYSTSGDTVDKLRNSTLMSSPLGEATADAAVFATGADFGYLCGCEMWGNLQPGTITWDELVDAYTENRILAIAEVTPLQLKQLLEVPAGKLVLDETTKLIDKDASSAQSFPQLSGLKISFDLSAPVGDRVRKIQIIGGALLDLEDNTTTYTLVSTDFMFSGGYGMPEIEYEACSITVAEAMAKYIQHGFHSSYNSYIKTKRVVFEGSSEDSLYSRVPKGLIYIIIAMILVCQFYRKKAKRSSDDRSVDW